MAPFPFPSKNVKRKWKPIVSKHYLSCALIFYDHFVSKATKTTRQTIRSRDSQWAKNRKKYNLGKLHCLPQRLLNQRFLKFFLTKRPHSNLLRSEEKVLKNVDFILWLIRATDIIYCTIFPFFKTLWFSTTYVCIVYCTKRH